MVIKTGHEIWNDVEDCDTSEFNKAPQEKWYKASDIDKRIAFYNEHYDEHSDFEREYCNLYKRKKAEIEEYDYFSGWLFDFCFTNLDKDFEEMLK